MRITQRSVHSGQAGLIVLLLTVVLLTVGLSVATRSTTDLKVSRQEEESNRVFNAAEAGIDDALSQPTSFAGQTYTGSVNVDPNISVSYSIQKVNVLQTRLFEGISAQVDVSGPKSGSEVVRINWGRETACGQNPASLLVTVFSQSGATVTARNLMYAPNCGRSDNIPQVSTTGTNNYFRQVSVPMQSNDVFIRIKPLYNDTSILVEGQNWNLPNQYYRVKSVAESQIGDEVRAVEVNKTQPVAPSIFDYVLFSGTTINK